MPSFLFEGKSFDLNPGESVLESLERHEVALASSCRAGICQACLVRVVEGSPPAAAQKGVSDALRAQGYVLACQCRPEETLTLERGSAQRKVRAHVERVFRLNHSIAGLRLRPEQPFEYFPGQFINLVHPAGQIRSYSLASIRTDDCLELHIGRMPGGCVSTWVHDELAAGDSIEFLGPQGNCFYVPGRPDQPLFLLGTGTGLAPLYGILRDALAQGHQAPIHLFHGSLHAEGLYLVEELRALAAAREQFHYHPCALYGDPGNGLHTGAIDAWALETIPSLKGWRVFLCGHPDLVRAMQKKTFLAGAGLKDILADAFLPGATPAGKALLP